MLIPSPPPHPSCEMREVREMQARMADVLGLHRTTSNSTASIAGSIGTKTAFMEIVKRLHQAGVTPEMIKQKESEILNIFNPQNTAVSGQIDYSNIPDQARLPERGCSDARTLCMSSH